VPATALARPLSPHAIWLRIGSLKTTVSDTCVALAAVTPGPVVSGGAVGAGLALRAGDGVGVDVGAPDALAAAEALALDDGLDDAVSPAVGALVAGALVWAGRLEGRPRVPPGAAVSHATSRSASRRR
jgi:hypothetical protein